VFICLFLHLFFHSFTQVATNIYEIFCIVQVLEGFLVIPDILRLSTSYGWDFPHLDYGLCFEKSIPPGLELLRLLSLNTFFFQPNSIFQCSFSLLSPTLICHKVIIPPRVKRGQFIMYFLVTRLIILKYYFELKILISAFHSNFQC
jgi:hypothetical protein